MRRIILALTAIGTAAMFATSVSAGSVPYGHNYGAQHQQAPPGAHRRATGPDAHNRSREEQRIQQIRKECRTYAFKYWRYHPDYQHCRYY